MDRPNHRYVQERKVAYVMREKDKVTSSFVS
uniref:Uncharacterized protein n=1 Tax=Lepeophtheirus salmonis TaxID=72036 RepID=A0A0K2T6T8_LEPSM